MIDLAKMPKLRAWLVARHGKKSDKKLTVHFAEDVKSNALTPVKLSELANADNRKGSSVKKKSKVPSKLASVIVKGASGSLSHKRAPVKRKDGSTLVYKGREMEHLSDYHRAVAGVYFKFLMRKQGMNLPPLTEWEKSLLYESAEKDIWSGDIGQEHFAGDTNGNRVPPSMVKAVLDDSVSGGIFLNPAVIDTEILTYPLLYGQLFPYVDVEEVTARRIMLPTLQNPTLNWGTAEGTAITEFNTASMIGDIDTAIYPVTGAIELGRDLQEDSPIRFGDKIIQAFSERLQSELDRVIAIGDGITQPLGLFNSSSTTIVNSDNGRGGPWTVSDLEAMLFAVPKQYRDNAALTVRFLTNDVSYRRWMAIPVGAGDERRVFGMDHSAYKILDTPVSISPNIPNGQAACLCCKKYRMYRRMGIQFQLSNEGKSLLLNNTTLFVMRARFGGTVMDPTAVATMSDGQQ